MLDVIPNTSTQSQNWFNVSIIGFMQVQLIRIIK